MLSTLPRPRLAEAASPPPPAAPDLAQPAALPAARLALVRERLAALGAAGATAGTRPLGVPALDAALPGGGLGSVGLHRFAGASPEWDGPAAAGFALALARRLQQGGDCRPLVWIGPAPPYAPGLASLGLDPRLLLTVRAAGEVDQLWALEEVLRGGQALAAIAFLRGLDRLAGRRLQLAAERGGSAALAVENRPREEPVPALTRWRIAAAPSSPAAPPLDPARPAWRVELLQARGGRPQVALLEWDHATAAFAVAAGLRDRAVASAAAAG